jgi:hypothetical protein
MSNRRKLKPVSRIVFEQPFGEGPPALATFYKGLPENEDEWKRLAIASAQDRGCNCYPDVDFEIHDGVTVAKLYHDDWCSFLQALEREGN